MPNIAKPTKLKVLAGNPGKRKLNKKEPQPTAILAMPNGMSTMAQIIWKLTVYAMPAGVFTAADQWLIVTYCEAVATHTLATEHLEANGHIVTGSMGQPVRSPWSAIQSDQARLICTIGAQLGLSPTARRSLTVEEPSQAESKFGIH